MAGQCRSAAVFWLGFSYARVGFFGSFSVVDASGDDAERQIHLELDLDASCMRMRCNEEPWTAVPVRLPSAVQPWAMIPAASDDDVQPMVCLVAWAPQGHSSSRPQLVR